MKKSAQKVEAVVGGIAGEGSRRYAFTYPNSSIGKEKHPKGTVITFSLSGWDEESPPEKGQLVILTGVKKFAKGWRARGARPVTYEAQPTATSKRRK